MTFYTNNEILRVIADCITYHQPIGDLEIALNTGCNVNHPVHKGLRPLHYAAYENAVEVAELLIDKGQAKVNISDDVGYTPLHIAAKNGNLDVLNLLIDKGAVVNFLAEGLLTGDEWEDGYIADSRALAELTVNPLNLALENNHPQCAHVLLQHGADPNQYYFLGHEINLVPLENVACIEMLLQHGANPNSYNRAGLCVLHKAAKLAYNDVIRLLLQYGADIDMPCSDKCDEQRRAIHFALMANHKETVQLLLEMGASTKRPDNCNSSPLDWAVGQDRIDMCRLLLAFGADPNEVNVDFCSPLQVACSTPGLLHQKQIIEVLLEAGADPNYTRATYSYLVPCLSPTTEYLAYNHHYDPSIFCLLFQHGAEINISKATKKTTIKDKCGILSQIRKLKNDESTLDLFLEVAGSFNYEEIEYDRTGLSDRQRTILIEEAQTPRSLSHLSRLSVRRLIAPPKLQKIKSLPIPEFFKKFLTYDFENVKQRMANLQVSSVSL